MLRSIPSFRFGKDAAIEEENIYTYIEKSDFKVLNNTFHMKCLNVFSVYVKIRDQFDCI